MAGLVDFKNEEEVKDYLDNLGTEYSYQCFKEKQPDGCNRLAEYFENIKKNFESAAPILKINCDQNEHSESCYKLGAYYVTGKDKFLCAQDRYNILICTATGKITGLFLSFTSNTGQSSFLIAGPNSGQYYVWILRKVFLKKKFFLQRPFSTNHFSI